MIPREAVSISIDILSFICMTIGNLFLIIKTHMYYYSNNYYNIISQNTTTTSTVINYL